MYYFKRMYLDNQYWNLLMNKNKNQIIMIGFDGSIKNETWSKFPYWSEYQESKSYVNEWKKPMAECWKILFDCQSSYKYNQLLVTLATQVCGELKEIYGSSQLSIMITNLITRSRL